MKRKELHQSNNNIEVMECETLENPKKKMIRPDPVQKEQKYDRQLRLWGNDGQTALENANVCLINATTSGTETLKCLVLPGIAKYMIIDNADVTHGDLSKNFFVDVSSLGKSRAQVTCQMIQELNPDSSGSWMKEDAMTILENDPQFFSNFTAVICSRVCEHDLLKLSNHLWARNIPLFIIDSVGFFGYLRLVIKEHAIVKARPDNTLEDLRLDVPFAKLVDYFDSMDFEKMDNLQHGHTPYLVILYKALKLWQHDSGNVWPQSYKEKCQIKDYVRNLNLKNNEGVPIPEENFEEALVNANSVFSKTQVPCDVQIILDNPLTNHPLESETNSKFWILVSALKMFVNQNKVLPLRGSLPDMFSDSKRYIDLQNVYKEKAEQDMEEVNLYVKESLEALQLPESFISEYEVKEFCKNTAFLKVHYGFSYHDEVKQELTDHKITETLKQQEGNGLDVYIAFRTFYKYLDNLTTNSSSLNTLTEIAKYIPRGLEILDASKNILEEMLRLDLNELHSMSAIMGGICAQEVIKVLTRQFVPVDNTLLINNILQQTVSMKL